MGLAILRPLPHRGDVIAAGVVVLVTLIGVVDIRFEGEWGTGIHLVVDALAFAFVFALAVQAPQEAEHPRAYQTILYVAAFVLALATLSRLADVLGADERLESSGTVTWVGALLTLLAGWFAGARNSPVCTLLAAATFGVTFLSFIDWVFSPDGISTFRWILLLLLVGYALAAMTQRDVRPRHGVAFVDTVGLAVLALAGTFVIEGFVQLFASAFESENGARSDGFGVAWGWELVVLAVAFGLIAFSAVEREAGPGWFGAAALFAFLVLAAEPDDGASLVGWPLVLIVAAAAMLYTGLRPAQPLPPAPDADTVVAETTPLHVEDEP